MPVINITIQNKVATVLGTPIIICGNSDYSILFTFDDEWNAYDTKTARFVFCKNGEAKYIDQIFTGDTVPVPVLSGIAYVMVGVFAGDLHTTTPAKIYCERSILCGGGAPEDPPENVYDQIMALIKGDIFYPYVDEEGNLSWSNTKGLENPPTVNIRGPQGIQGERGIGIVKIDQTETSLEDDGYNSFVATLSNGEQYGLTMKNGSKGSQGEKGEKGDTGPQGEQGEKGEKGDPGKDSALVPISGCFTLAVDDDGNLWAYSTENESAPVFEYDSDTGKLYFVTEQE